MDLIWVILLIIAVCLPVWVVSDWLRQWIRQQMLLREQARLEAEQRSLRQQNARLRAEIDALREEERRRGGDQMEDHSSHG